MAPKRAAEQAGRQNGKKAKTSAPERPGGGKLYFLLKKPVDVLTVKQIEEAPGMKVAITGIHNKSGKGVLEAMQDGDEVLIYSYSNQKSKAACEPSITGLCLITEAAYPDPTDKAGKGFASADMKLEEVFEEPIMLPSLKEHRDAELKGFTLFSNKSAECTMCPRPCSTL